MASAAGGGGGGGADLAFNVIDWQALRVAYPGRSADPDAAQAYTNWTRSPYVAFAFGRDAEGGAVGLRIKGFRPYLLVRPPQDWPTAQCLSVAADVLKLCRPKAQWQREDDDDREGEEGDAADAPKPKVVPVPEPEVAIKAKLVTLKDLWGFTGGAPTKFLRFSCLNQWMFNRVKRAFDKPLKERNHAPARHAAAVEAWLATPVGQCRPYEANVDPLLRLIHVCKLRSCGWIRIKGEHLRRGASGMTMRGGSCVAAHYKHVRPDPTMRLAPMRIASFDLECTSSHGDFPQAVKSYRKLAGDLYVQRAAMRTADDVQRAVQQAFRNGTVVPKDAITPEDVAARLADTCLSGRAVVGSLWEVLRGRDASRLSLSGLLPARATGGRPDLSALVGYEELLDVEDLKALRLATRCRTTADAAEEDAQSAELGHLSRYTPRTLPKLGAARPAAAGEEGDDDGERLMDPAKDRAIYLLNGLLTASLPPLEGDAIINISTTVHRFGQAGLESRRSIALCIGGACDPVPGADVVAKKTERELIEAWVEHIRDIDPDVLCGYNIVGFDWPYLWARAGEVGAREALTRLTRVRALPAEFKVQNLSSSALGDNVLKYLAIPGRLSIDMYKVIQREKQLESYKLDSVSQEFLGQRKDDVSPKEIFRLYKLGQPAGLATIAKYCVQDCALVNQLVVKLKTIENNSQMANVCSVPLSFIFMRGQGIKILSLVARKCRELGFAIPTVRPCDHPDGCSARPAYDHSTTVWDQRELRRDRRCAAHRAHGMTLVLPTGFDRSAEDDEAGGEGGRAKPEEEAVAYAESDGYEGALVLDPEPGMHFEPVTVLDYNSLYPSSMISENMSHDSIVLDKKYDNLPGYTYNEVRWSADAPPCRFAAAVNGEKAVLPQVLVWLLKVRKDTRKKMKYVTVTLRDGRTLVGLPDGTDGTEGQGLLLDVDTDQRFEYDPADVTATVDTYDESEIAVLDALQTALKVTANSLYGQTGARTSAIHMKEIAACTTAVGRDHILKAKDFVESKYGAKVIYGDTDSIFIKFPLGGLTGKDALAESIRMGQLAEREIKAILKPPQALAYEKTMLPFIIMSKKRYVGLLYETDINKCKKKYMGIVLKRRDNPNVCKVLYSDVLDAILYREDVAAGVAQLKEDLQKLVAGGYPIIDMVLSKTLKGEYKDPTRIAHNVLAERMGARDAGTKPATNDRVAYVFVRVEPQLDDKGRPIKLLQGDRIEPPDYVVAHNLPIDYGHYIQCQIMVPISQLLALALDKIPGFVPPPDFATWPMAKREREVQLLLFQPFIDHRIPGSVGREREMAASAAEVAANPPYHRLRVSKDATWTLADATGTVMERGQGAGSAKDTAPTLRLAAVIDGLDALIRLTDGNRAVIITDNNDLHGRLTKTKAPAKGPQVDLMEAYDEICISTRLDVVLRK